MKKILLLLLVIAFVCSLSTAHAALLGIEDWITSHPSGIVPDIYYNAGGTANYDADNQFFAIQGGDKTLWLSKPGDGIDLQRKVNFNLYAWFENGRFVEGYMVEYVLTDFSFDWNNKTYSFEEGQLFLGAYLAAIGWGDNRDFDYITQNDIYGALKDYGLWPNIAIAGYMGTYIWGDWVPWGAADLVNLATEKGDKVPIPEPATMLLLGSGLVGLAGYARRRFRK